MRIDSVSLRNFKCFKSVKLEFPELRNDDAHDLSNIHVLLGVNGSGKSSLLQAIALGVLCTSVQDSGLLLRALTRRHPGQLPASDEAGFKPTAVVGAQLGTWNQTTHAPTKNDIHLGPSGSSRDRVIHFGLTDEEAEEALRNEHGSDAFFLLGYGANRRMAPGGEYRFGVHDSRYAKRIQRIATLFDDTYFLVPLSAWFTDTAPRIRDQVKQVLSELVGDSLQLTTRLEDGELVVEQRGVSLPVYALSDGFRSYLAWVCDLLYHLVQGVGDAEDSDIRTHRGTILVDEVDLHLHPAWQQRVLPSLSKTFPNLQFIVSTHSPLVVGTVRAENLHVLKTHPEEGHSEVEQAQESPYGLSTDQILVSPWFGLENVRDRHFENRLSEVRKEAMTGDLDAFLRLNQMMSNGEAGDHEPPNADGGRVDLSPADKGLLRKAKE